VVAAALGAAIAIGLTPVTPAGVPVIAATAACLVGLARPRRDPQQRRAPSARPQEARP
jgi:hypothetical protein